MSNNIKYKNHYGREVNLFGDGVWCSVGEFDDWELETIELNNRISQFGVPIREFGVPVVIAAYDDNELNRKIDELYDIAAVDLLEYKAGMLVVGDWSLRGFFNKSKKKQTARGGASYELGYITDDPYWTQEKTVTFSVHAEVQCLDHPYDHPYDLGSITSRNEVIDNPSVTSSPFRMIIDGECDNPRITIGSNVYQVDVQLEEKEKLIIDCYADGKKKTITKRSANGVDTNVFSKRVGVQKKGSGSYIFEEIPAGTSSVIWTDDNLSNFSWELTMYERRMARRH